jgi:hypothetical protein
MAKHIILTKIKPEQRLKILLICRKNKELVYTKKNITIFLPTFLTLIFQCIKNTEHTRTIMMGRLDFINENIKLIQPCLKCKEPTNLIGVR